MTCAIRLFFHPEHDHRPADGAARDVTRRGGRPNSLQRTNTVENNRLEVLADHGGDYVPHRRQPATATASMAPGRDLKIHINEHTWLPTDRDGGLHHKPTFHRHRRHLYLDRPPRNSRATDPGHAAVITGASTSPEPSLIVCQTYGKAGHFERRCAEPDNARGTSTKPVGKTNQIRGSEGVDGHGGDIWLMIPNATRSEPLTHRRVVRTRLTWRVLKLSPRTPEIHPLINNDDSDKRLNTYHTTTQQG